MSKLKRKNNEGKYNSKKFKPSKKNVIEDDEIEKDNKKPEEILSPEQQEIIDIVMNEKKSLFFTGSGGCGKTFTLNVLIKKLYAKYGENNIGVTSSTGLSAMNIGDCMRNSKNKKLFGGIQLVLSGDFLQLRPVRGKYAFESKVWDSVVEKYVMLKKPYRQTDMDFIDGLNKMRFGEIDLDFLEYIKSLSREIKYEDGDNPTRLFSTVRQVEICNKNKLNDLPGRIIIFKAEEWSVAGKNNKSTLSESTLNLKIGAKVLYIWNEKENNKLVNGTKGKVVEFKNGNIVYRDKVPENVASVFLKPIVKFSGIEEEIEITPKKFFKKNNDGVIMATCKQLPLILRYSISIHKSQGMSIFRLVVDCNNIFQSEQLYVALSRATDPNNLQVLNFNQKKLKANEK
ncbi:7841_t:CDS:2, partial [Cetraspora pellucida]